MQKSKNNINTFIFSSLKMMTRVAVLFLLLVVGTMNLNAQTIPVDSNVITGASIGSFFDKIFDNKGNAYSLAQFRLPNAQGMIPTNPNAKQSSQFTCNSGYFTIWFEQDWNGIGTSQLNTAQTALAQATICKVFQDISNFIQRPSGATDNVQIWIRDITQMGVSNPGSTQTAGVSSPFLYAPPYKSGIADNLVWLTINGGKDGFTNIVAPLSTNSNIIPGSAGYFHGQFALNFANTSINWNLNHTAAPQTGASAQTDLYTIVFHEMLHFLGINSNINYTGLSVLGNSYQYFSRFDMNLQTASGTKLLTTPTVNCNPIYQNAFNASVPLTAITTGGAVNTQTNVSNLLPNCIRYASANVGNIPVYNPAVYEIGGSLSHLEDFYATTGGSPGGIAGNDLYYVMSNGTDKGVMKRFPREQERIILNNIGYKVNNTFGSNASLNLIPSTVPVYAYTATTTTTPAIDNGVQTVGYCDGVANGAYTYTVTPGGAVLSIPITGTTGILNNDYNATSISCVEVMNSTAVTYTVTAVDIRITAPSTTTPSLLLLRYIPTRIVGANTFYGNITYIYVLVNGDCPVSPCNLVSNNDFENYSPGNQCWAALNSNSTPYISCFSTYCQSPDIFRSGCTGIGYQIPTMNSWYTPNIISGNSTNTFVGMVNLGGLTEVLQTKLSSPLVPGAFYTIKFLANDATNSSYTNVPYTASSIASALSFYGSNGTLAYQSIFSPTNVGVVSISPLIENITMPIKLAWNTFSITFQYNSTSTILLDNLIIANNNSAISANTFNSILIDQIELKPGSGGITFTPPSSANCNGIISNLTQYLNAIPTSGVTFTGPNNSVYQNGTQWDFNPALAGNGNAIVTCTYTDLSGCIVNVSANIMVSNSFAITVSSNPCLLTGGTATLTANGMPAGSTINWTNGSNVSIGSASTQTITTAGTYFATVTSGGCSSTVGVSNQASQCANTLASNLPTSIASTPSLNANGYIITANTTISGNVLLKNTDVSIKNGALITVANGATLTIEASHLHGCTDMWAGITVSPGGKLIVNGNVGGASSFIEDASVAVNVPTHTSTTNIIDISNTIFNKNSIGISISDYVQNTNTYPFKIEGNVFTCRTFPTPACPSSWPNWPTVATLQTATTNTLNVLPSPYTTLTSYPLATLLNLGVEVSQMHIKAVRVGYTDGTISAPTYTGMLNLNTIGTGTLVPAINLFDNAGKAIYAEDANIKIVNNVIQNCVYGIQAIGTLGYKKSTAQQPYSGIQILNSLTATNTIGANKFYDNKTSAILVATYANVDILNNEFRSTQTKANISATLPQTNALWNTNTVGKCAINVVGNNTLVNNIKNNFIYNNKVGVLFQQTIAPLGSSTTTFNKFPGNMHITGNTIQPAPTGGLTGTILPFIAEGVTATMSGGPLTTTFTIQPSATKTSLLNIDANTINNVWRGIEVLSFNWPKDSTRVTNNTITQDVDPSTNTTNMQHGVWCANNKGSLYVRANNCTFNGAIPASVTSMATLFNTNANVGGRQTNYRLDQNDRQVITCNISQRGMIGFEFNGVSANTQFRNGNNMLSNHFLGFLLNNGAIIGVQPAGINTTTCASNAPNIDAGNIWSFAANNTANQPKHTWVQNAATATSTCFPAPNQDKGAALSAMQVPSGGVNRPQFNSGNIGGVTQYGNPLNNSLRTVSGAAIGGCANPLPSAMAMASTGGGNLQVLNAVATGLTFETMSTELNYMDKYYLYTLQKANADYITSSTELQNFYNTANATTNNYRKMYDIDEAMSQGNIATAQTLNTAFTPTNVAENNTKTYNDIAIKVQNGQTLSSTDNNNLVIIANECPHTDGVCVYNARILYNQLAMNTGGNYVSFPDDCNPSGLYKTTPNQKIIETEIFDFVLFPNPTTEGFNIKITEGVLQNARVIITDLLGKEINSLPVSFSNNQVYVDIKLSPNMYLIKVVNKNNEKIIKKILVQ
jgi:hypothetical protein